MPSFLRTLLRESTQPVGLVNTRDGHVIADRLLAAVDSKSRRTGLLTRTGLPQGSAMIIAPTNAIHTFFMKFPIDVLFVARNGRVLKICRALPAWRIAAAWGAYCVIELAAGSVERTALRRDDVLLTRVLSTGGCQPTI